MKEEIQFFIKKCCNYFNIIHPIKFTIKYDSSEDIWCYPHMGEIHVGQKWLKAWSINKDEAKKRILHEFIHIKYKLPDNIKDLHYYSHPWKDFFSAVVYEMMLEGVPFTFDIAIRFLEDKLKDKNWIKKWQESGKLGWW